MLGYSEAELLSLNVQALLTATDTSPDTSPDPGVEAQQQAAACRQPTEGCYRHKQGHPVWVRVTLSQLCDDQGQPLYYSAQIHNINDRKLVELELQQVKAETEADYQAKSRRLAEQLAAMNHDLRTPLSAILGYGQLMARDAQTPQQQAQLEIINRNGEYLLQRINDLFSFSGLESEQEIADREDADDADDIDDADLPFPQPPVSLASVKEQRVLGLEPGQPSYRVLVVDDTDTNRKLMTHWLKLAGFEVQQADNGQMAVEQAIQFRPDLIWMDLRMPVMNGREATQQIREAANQASNSMNQAMGGAETTVQPWQPKIIALTAAAFEDERHQLLAVGFDDFLSKPCSESVFFGKIAQHLQLSYRYEAPASDLTSAPSQATRTNLQLEQLVTQPTMPAEPMVQSMVQPFASMPADWVAQLNYAARSANEKKIFELLEALPADCHELKASVTRLVQEFQLSQLIRLTQSAQP